MENPKFILLNESLKAIKKGSINLLCVKGQAGCGKTRTILDHLKGSNFKYFSSYSTPLYFYKLIFDNKDSDILIFDDLEGINDLKIISMLKGLCWSPDNKEREISYFSTSDKLQDYGLPYKFNTNSRIILIFNNDLRGFEPIINRGVLIDFNFNFQDKIQIFESLKGKAKIDSEVLNYIKVNCNESTQNLSLRTLVILSNLKKDGFDFKIFAKEILNTNEENQLIIDLVQKCKTLKDACAEWVKQTGKSRRTFFYYYSKLK